MICIRLIVASLETLTAPQFQELEKKTWMLMSAWVRCQMHPGQYHRSLRHLQPQGFTGQKVTVICLVLLFLCLIFAHLGKALLIINHVALVQSGGGKTNPLSLYALPLFAVCGL